MTDLKKSKESTREGVVLFSPDGEEAEDTDEKREERNEAAKKEGEVLTCLVQPWLLTAEQALNENR